ncbi:MAG: OadG family protein, partial [Lachnospiraceae bacterium]|nr:OadG family protein [Lachnospiraceae bacterium]
YIPEEMVVTAVYSNSELMGQAGMNTLIGMGTVFVVLLFISFIISLFKYLPALFAKKTKVPEPKKDEAPAKAAQSAPVASENLMNDAELVAVITAAIYAASGSTNGSGAVSKDTLVVRSIRRAKK